MIVRYATTGDGIDNECSNICCASEEIIQKMKNDYYKNYKRWIIERDLINSEKKIFKRSFYNKEYNFDTSKFNCIEFDSKEAGENFLQTHLNKNLFIKIENIKEEDKEGKFEGFNIEYRIVPYDTFLLPYIGSSACEHCPYCYGRNKKYPGFELIGWNNKNLKFEDFSDSSLSNKLKDRNKNLTMREAYYIRCSAIYIQDKIGWKIKIRRYLYQLWVNKLEQKIKKLINKN